MADLANCSRAVVESLENCINYKFCVSLERGMKLTFTALCHYSVLVSHNPTPNRNWFISRLFFSCELWCSKALLVLLFHEHVERLLPGSSHPKTTWARFIRSMCCLLYTSPLHTHTHTHIVCILSHRHRLIVFSEIIK